MATTTVGVLGTGNMGSAIARRLLDCGHPVAVWNRTPDRAEPLAEAGATVARTPAGVARAADLVIANVADHAATLAVLESAGTAEALAGRTLLQTATILSGEAEALRDWADARGIRFLSAAIFSYPMQLMDGAGGLVYAGPRDVFDAHLEVFRAFDAEPRYVSDRIGAAAVFDKALLSGFYGCSLALIHGAAMCRRYGIDVDLFTRMSREDVVVTFDHLGPMLRDAVYDRDIEASMETYKAVVETVLGESEALGVDTALPALAKRYIDAAIAAGHAGDEIAVICEQMLEDGAGG